MSPIPHPDPHREIVGSTFKYVIQFSSYQRSLFSGKKIQAFKDLVDVRKCMFLK